MNGLVTAIEFLTIIRLRRAQEMDGEAMARSLPWLSVVGLLIGIVLVGVDLVAATALPEPARSAIVLVAAVVLTGGLHLDGLADTCDGLFGGMTPERRLEIMRDSRTGAFGVIGIIMVLLLKWSALLSLTGSIRLAALLTVPALSRMALVAAIAIFPYARPTGLGRYFHERAGVAAVVLSALPSAIALAISAGPYAPALIVPAYSVVLLGGWFIKGKIGGLTGDSYGALVEAGETLLLLLFAAALKIWGAEA